MFKFAQVCRCPFLLNHIHLCSTHSQSKIVYPTCQSMSKLRTVRRTKAAFVQLFQVCISSASSSYPTSFIAQVVQQHLAPKSSPPHYIGFALAYWNQLSLVIQAWGHKTEHHCQPFSYQETFYSLLKIDFLWSLV